MRNGSVACRLVCLPLVSLALLLTAGCNSKVEECNKLITVLNQESGKISEGMKGTDAGVFKKMADDLDAAVKTIGEVEVKTPELVKFRDDMKKSYTEFSAAARGAGQSMESDPVKAMGSLKQLTDLATQNSKLVGDINSFCHAK
ncbi:hypothetical protein [Chondromyces crocatus]|uniref:Lipoprotein n=1 Tax=Chondromyces crocatus TaxID=52 RepID=A0A0K1E891_CHOCO|nr:hypothetical protein [Chondromyces crocatus]AKT36803.1 uncharacterized protein CMC5_009240 [Chondromyces crocatus]